MIDFFLAGPLRVKALLIVIPILLAGAGGLFTWGLYWRGEAREALVTVAILEAQGKILSEATRACSEGVAEASRVGRVATEHTRSLLGEARRLAAAKAPSLAQIEDLLRKPPTRREDGTPVDCRDAWQQIEAIEQKAGR